MKIYTIGFTKKTAEQFFSLLKKNNIKLVIDIRLNPDGQLSGFAKKDDLIYFLSHLIDCEYLYIPALAPTDDILKDYRKDKDWDKYVRRFSELMDKRNIPQSLDHLIFEGKNCCLLCSEATPENCHRRLVAERLSKSWENVEIEHLV